MKNYLGLMAILLFMATIFLQACSDDETADEFAFCTQEATIIGKDFRLCACCGGWFIEIGDDTLRASVLPQSFREQLIPGEYPIPVYLEWNRPENLCLGDEIDVPCIKLND